MGGIMNAMRELSDAAAPMAARREMEKILLVDDDPAIRRVLTRLLAGEGYSVSSACSGAEAIHFASRVDFDLVLLDLKMPGMDGWDVYEQLASRNPLLPVIVITARPNQNFMALAAGIGALMEKPLDLEKLLPTIRSLLDEPEDVRFARVTGRLPRIQHIPPAA
jgi:CheY-like chemotaxis protein